MKSFLEKYSHYFLLIEVTATIAILLVLSGTAYDCFLKSTLDRYSFSKQAVQKQRTTLIQKQLLVTNNKKITIALQQWKQKSPDFYNAMKTPITFDQIFQTLTPAILQSGFSIVRIEPIFDQKNNRKPNHLLCALNLKLDGHFQNLFSLLSQFNKLAIPLTIMALKMNHANQIAIKLATGESRD